MNLRTLLVPVDFSTCSLLVVRQAAGLARLVGARLVLFHAAELPAGLAPDVALSVDGATRRAAAYVDDDVRARLAPFADAARAAGVAVEVAVETGPVVPTIVAAIDAHGADLVVIGTHGRTGLARMVLGSVAEGVAHRARVPVMLVRREVRAECGRGSCDWCAVDGRSPAEDRVAAESQG